MEAPPLRDDWRAMMQELSDAGLKTYRALVYETPRFIEFWSQATPLHEIEQLRIGSRPARRSNTPSVQTLRAIPWVFSWMQSRFNLPGWYGLGSALDRVVAHRKKRILPIDFIDGVRAGQSEFRKHLESAGYRRTASGYEREVR